MSQTSDPYAVLYWGLAVIMILLATAFWWYIWKKGYLGKKTIQELDEEPAGGEDPEN